MFSLNLNIDLLKILSGDFPGGQVFELHAPTERWMGLIPGQGTKIPHAMKHKKKEKKTLDNVLSDQQNDQFSKIPESDIAFFPFAFFPLHIICVMISKITPSW